jgi:hypothetical protein
MRWHFSAVVGIGSLIWTAVALGQFEALDRRAGDGAAPEHLIEGIYRSELEGDSARYAELLKEALAEAPEERRVNWLAGRVLVDGAWQSYGDHQKATVADERLKEYRWRRDALDGTPRLEAALARWCAENRWPDLERLHYARVLAHPRVSDNLRREALRNLGIVQHDGQLFTAAELALYQQQVEQKGKAFEKWREKIVGWRKAIAGKKQEEREAALQELRQVDDPQVLLAAEASLYDSYDLFRAELIALIGRFPELEATQALLRYALLGNSEVCVDAAVAELKPRSVHDYYPHLLPLLQAPVHSEFRLRNISGTIRYEHLVSQQRPQENKVVLKDAVAQPRVDVTETSINVNVRGGNPITTQSRVDPRNPFLRADSFSGGKQTMQEELLALSSFLTALTVQHKINLLNQSLFLQNERVFYLLEQTSPEQFPRNPSVWWAWWKEYNEQRPYTPTNYVYQPTWCSYAQYTPLHVTTIRYASCFVAGTTVVTETGDQAIETIQVGDRVLSQDVETGELAFKVVTGKILREPWPVVRMAIGSEEIIATKAHPFWVAGEGWKMAKELKAHDTLCSVAGPRSLDAAEPLAAPQQAYNLYVEDFNTYFVGKSGLLVHDNTYWKPTTTLVPGLKKPVK